MLYAYIDKDKHPRSIECSFDGDGKYKLVSDKIISTERTYSSVAIVEGTVTGDKNSSGKCVQAFLKLSNLDNSYLRYRIQRYQLQDGGTWTKQQNNLVLQNYQWAYQYINLTAVNYPKSNGKNINQFMCLFYAADNCNYPKVPLKCAWALTDQLVYDNKRKPLSIDFAGPLNTQYIGYIEGVPPYHLNHPSNNGLYYNDGDQPISSVELASSSTNTNSKDLSYSLSGSVSFHSGFLKADLKAAFENAHKNEFTTSASRNIVFPASDSNNVGWYVTLAPTITRAFYWQKDWNNTIIDSTYNFFMSDAILDLPPVQLKNGLIAGNLNTYCNRTINGIPIDFDSYNHFGPDDPAYSTNTWSKSENMSTFIGVEQSVSNTNHISGTLSFNAELGKMFDVGFEGSFDYSLETTTSTGNSAACFAQLNDPVDPTDVKSLSYDWYWITPGDNGTNWWLHDSAQQQNTWCITYDLRSATFKDGSSISRNKRPISNTDPGNPGSGVTEFNPGNSLIETTIPMEFSLSQNYPNPFSPATKIRYQIGMDNSQSGANIQANISKLVVYNLSGKEVATLVNEIKTPGSYEVSWDASLLSPGVYFYSLQSGSFKDVKKLVLLK
jgi:hypothetical protein